MLQMNAIRRTEDLNAFHRSPEVAGQEVCDVTHSYTMVVEQIEPQKWDKPLDEISKTVN